MGATACGGVRVGLGAVLACAPCPHTHTTTRRDCAAPLALHNSRHPTARPSTAHRSHHGLYVHWTWFFASSSATRLTNDAYVLPSLKNLFSAPTLCMPLFPSCSSWCSSSADRKYFFFSRKSATLPSSRGGEGVGAPAARCCCAIPRGGGAERRSNVVRAVVKTSCNNPAHNPTEHS